MTTLRHTFLTLTLAAATLAVSCGAPTKSAADVASLFDTKAVSLQARETSVCKRLAERTTAPSTKDMDINLDQCQGAGLAAPNYKEVDSFYFVDLPTKPGVAVSKDVTKKTIRAQIWLNRSFLDLATTLLEFMKKNSGGNQKGELKLPDSATKAIANLAKPVIRITEDPVFDLATIAFTMKLNLQINGALKVNQDLKINGKLIDDAFAVTAQTLENKPYEESLIKRFSAVIVIIPYATDVYLDMFVDLDIYNIGPQSVVDTQLNTFLSTGLKGVIDSLLTL